MGQPVAISLPPADKAKGIRDGIRDRADWKLEEVVEGWGLVSPNEGVGTVYPYFKTTKLCDANTTLTESTFDALAKNPAWPRDHIPARTAPDKDATTDWPKALIEWGNKVSANGRRGSDLVGVSANLGGLSPDEVPNYLLHQAPLFFKENPDSSLWFFEVDQLFTGRTVLLRVLLALDTMPDFIEANEDDPGGIKIQTLQEHSLTGGIANEALVEVLLLAIPPSTMGFAWPLVRAVRNSAHGLMETFEKASERNIVVAHNGEMPPELPELAAFLAFAMIADAERVIAGTWWD